MRFFCFICASTLLAAPFASANGPAGTVSLSRAASQTISVVKIGPDGHLVRVRKAVRVAMKSVPLVRQAASSVAPAPPMPYAPAVDSGIQLLVEDAAKRHNVDPLLVNSVIRVESAFNPSAISPKGAQGLMQLIPATARRFGVDNPFDARENIEGGVKYLEYLQSLFPNDLSLTIAAYNAGEGAVSHYNSIPPYPETVAYVERVHQNYANAKRAQQRPEIVVAAAQTEEPVRHVQQVFDAEGRLYLVTR